MPVAQELVVCVEKLATLPAIYFKVREALDDPDITASQLAAILSSDPALSALLLRLANSAFYGFPRRIDTLSRAISLIGHEQLQEVVLATSVTATFSGIRPSRMDMARFWRHSLRTALLCRGLALALGRADPERLFVAGLLADAGHLVMFRAVPDLMDIVLQRSDSEGLGLDSLERQIVGCDYAEVGAALCNAWRLPLAFGVIVGAQLCPANGGEYAGEAAILNIANGLSGALEAGLSHESALTHTDAYGLAGVDPQQLPAVLASAEDRLATMLELFATPHF